MTSHDPECPLGAGGREFKSRRPDNESAAAHRSGSSVGVYKFQARLVSAVNASDWSQIARVSVT
jgi:hypothetical protein